jgi:hypothetical protein
MVSEYLGGDIGNATGKVINIGCCPFIRDVEHFTLAEADDHAVRNEIAVNQLVAGSPLRREGGLRNYLPLSALAGETEGHAMRERGGYITCAVATANGFAQPYRAKIAIHQDKPESSVLDLDAAALRESVAARLRGLPEKPDTAS